MNHRHNFLRLLGACVISLLIHSGGFAFYNYHEIFTQSLKTPSPQPLESKTEIPKEITLEFIPAPDKIIEKKPTVPTNIVSEKSTTAQNSISKPELSKGAAYQHGILEHIALERISSPAIKPQKPSPEQKNLFQESNPLLKELSPSQEEGITTKKGNLLKEKNQQKKKIEEDLLKQPQYEMFSKPQKPVPPIPRKVEELPTPAKKNLTSISEILGETSYNAGSNAAARYFAKEFKKISSVWRLELYTSGEFAHRVNLNLKKTVVVFQIMPDGHFEDLQVIEHEGDSLGIRYPVNAIEKTAPFTPLPKDVLSYIRTQGLWVRIEFNYMGKEKNKN